MKYPILLAVVLLGLVGCSQFSRSHFFSEGFGFDLNQQIIGKKFQYTDGCLQVFDVAETDPIYKASFPEKPAIEPVGIEIGDLNFYASQLGEIRYRRLLPDADIYPRVIFYIPKTKELVFAYATGIGG